MSKYEDSAKAEMFGIVGLLITIALILLFDKC